MPERVWIAAEREMEPGSVKSVVHGDRRIAVFHTEEGWYAIEDRCTHADVRLSDGWVEGKCVACPWHGAQFDLSTGEALSRPAILPVARFSVHREDGKVWVEL